MIYWQWGIIQEWKKIIMGILGNKNEVNENMMLTYLIEVEKWRKRSNDDRRVDKKRYTDNTRSREVNEKKINWHW